MTFLISKEHRAIIVPGGEDLPVRIPTAKPLDINGKRLWAVPFNVREAIQLRHIGVPVPSPIGTYYDWPRDISKVPTPFTNQVETSAFLTLNHRAYVLNQIGCVDADTEYLSPTGWKRIGDYTGGPVAQYWPETGRADFVENPEYVKLPCARMLRIRTKYGVDQLVSPEHRVLLHDKSNPGKREVVQAEELLWRQHEWQQRIAKKSMSRIGFSQAAIPTVFVGPERDGLGLTFAELRVQIAVIADGHFPNNTRRCVVRLKKGRKKQRLRYWLDKAGIQYREEQPEYASALGFSVFTFQAPLREKAFGPWAWEMNRAQLHVVADEVMHWDGSISDAKPTQRFATRQKESADFVQYAFASTGRTARMITRHRKDGDIDYEVSVRADGRPLGLSGQLLSKEPTTPITEVQAPDGFKYCFMVPSTFLVLRRNGCIFCTGNTGKTMAAMWAADYLMSVGMVRKALILSPLSTLDRVWGDAVFEHFGHRSIAILHGTAEKRKRLFANNAFDFYVINHDAVDIVAEMLYRQVKGQKKLVDARLLRDDIDLVIIDELAVYRNSQTGRWRILNKLLKPNMWVWGLTGTPTPNSPADAYGQIKLVTPERAPEYFSAFRQQVMQQMTEYIWVPRREAAKIVHQVMQPSIRFERDQCFDLPPCTYSVRECELTAEQKRHYKEIAKELFTEIQGGKITAVNEGVKAGKLLQIACGVVYDKDGKERTVDAAPRVALLREIIEQATNKVIVFVPFRAPLEMLYREMGKDFKCAMVHGGVSKSQRATIFLEFQKDPSLRVLLADAGTMSHGLTLTEANTVVWYGPEWSNDIYEQANGRITRSGQKNHQYIIHIAGTEIERRIYARLRERGRTQGVLLQMVKEGVLA